MNSKLLGGMAVAALWQGVSHYFPPAEPWKKPGVVRRIMAYTVGTIGILLGIGVATDRKTLATAACMAGAAGAATVSAYGIDWLLRRHYAKA